MRPSVRRNYVINTDLFASSMRHWSLAQQVMLIIRQRPMFGFRRQARARALLAHRDILRCRLNLVAIGAERT
jgi:hypothetical protein